MEAIVVAAASVIIAGLNYLRTRKVDKRVNHEFTNNGGTSARDLLDYLVVKVDKIEDEQIRVRAELAEVKDKIK
jgi:hypothetical protein